MKKLEFAVSVLLENPQNENEILIVKRPPDDRSLPNVWGLPTVVSEGELPEKTVRRVGREKLTTAIQPKLFVGIKYADRGDYELILMVVKARLIGKEPSVFDAETKGVKYVDQKWISDYHILKEGASKGSLCDQIVLESKNISWA